MNDLVCECVEERKESIKDLVIDQHELVISLQERLLKICTEMGCKEVNPDKISGDDNNLYSAINGNNDYIKVSHTLIYQIEMMLGI